MNRKYSIELAKTAGFCFGVDRAVSTLYKMVEEKKKVCTLGPIIHNPFVIEDLRKRGVGIIEAPSQAPEGTTVVIRTHGVERSVIDELKSKGIFAASGTVDGKTVRNVVKGYVL